MTDLWQLYSCNQHSRTNLPWHVTSPYIGGQADSYWVDLCQEGIGSSWFYTVKMKHVVLQSVNCYQVNKPWGQVLLLPKFVDHKLYKFYKKILYLLFSNKVHWPEFLSTPNISKWTFPNCQSKSKYVYRSWSSQSMAL